MLAYLARYTHRVAISNKRLIKADAGGVIFTFKDYRLTGADRYKTMTLAPGEFMRRFLLHILPKGFHRIRHDGLIAAAAPSPPTMPQSNDTTATPLERLVHPCPCCAAAMVIIETFEAGQTPRHRPRAPPPAIRIDTS